MRPEQQHALGDARTQRLKLLRVFQELDDLFELFFRFLDPGDVVERNLRAVLREHLRAGTAERKRLVTAALRLPEDKEQHQTQQRKRQQSA